MDQVVMVDISAAVFDRLGVAVVEAGALGGVEVAPQGGVARGVRAARGRAARARAAAARTTLENRTGTIGAPAAELDIHAVFLDSETFLYEPDRAGSALGWHRAALGLIVWVSETVTPSP